MTGDALAVRVCISGIRSLGETKNLLRRTFSVKQSQLSKLCDFIEKIHIISYVCYVNQTSHCMEKQETFRFFFKFRNFDALR